MQIIVEIGLQSIHELCGEVMLTANKHFIASRTNFQLITN